MAARPPPANAPAPPAAKPAAGASTGGATKPATAPASSTVKAGATTTAANNNNTNNGRIRIELSARHKEELRQAFDLFDSEGTGRVQASEIKVALRALGFEVKKEELRQLLVECGVAGASAAAAAANNATTASSMTNAGATSGAGGGGVNMSTLTIDFNDFLRILVYKMGEKETKEEVQRAFHIFDEGDKGFIGLDDLKLVSERLGQNLTEDELKEMMEFAHPKDGAPGLSGGKSSRADGNGARALQLSEEDFMRMMKRASVY